MRYNSLDSFYKSKFNCKIAKISLNGNFTCPNKDGSISYGGCIFCSKSGSGDYAGLISDNLVTQFYKIKEVIDKKWKNCKYIVYFQANSNTYDTLDNLKLKYESVLYLDNVVGINISTRPDCINDDVLEYLSELNKKTYLTIELGLQSIHEKTLNLINRNHTLECFTNCVKRLRRNNINVVVHIINGLPYETEKMMIDTVKYLNNIDIQGIKIHMLYVLKNTEIENLDFHILSKDEYINIVCNQLEYLNKNIVIHRITGDPKLDDLIEPKWLIKKFVVLNDINKELVKRDSYQGKKT